MFQSAQQAKERYCVVRTVRPQGRGRRAQQERQRGEHGVRAAQRGRGAREGRRGGRAAGRQRGQLQRGLEQ
jgi:hypothetical protein